MSIAFKQVKQGDKNDTVLLVQCLLSALSFIGANNKPLTLDGEYGFNTTFAVKTFQTTCKAYGKDIRTDGVCDLITLNAMINKQ